jgi:hypothetical protein
MLEYESLKSLFEFLVMPKNNKKHYSDSFNWTMAKFIHQVVMKVIRVVIQVAHYVAPNYDEVSIVDNQSWLSIYYYMVERWVRIPILICLEKVVAHSKSDNLTKVNLEALMINKGLP